mmetsp:Transcript_26315/g.69833  ORF Transcript_26315/g.69833 Transcript_26315/m.69833 type:complete len:163 (-) Transcript_26315:46-534(-)
MAWVGSRMLSTAAWSAGEPVPASATTVCTAGCASTNISAASWVSTLLRRDGQRTRTSSAQTRRTTQLPRPPSAELSSQGCDGRLAAGKQRPSICSLLISDLGGEAEVSNSWQHSKMLAWNADPQQRILVEGGALAEGRACRPEGQVRIAHSSRDFDRVGEVR